MTGDDGQVQRLLMQMASCNGTTRDGASGSGSATMSIRHVRAVRRPPPLKDEARP
jgi:hypothetical protein